MQIIKPGKLSLISKTYGFNGNQFAVGGLCFFQLGEDNALLTENSQWPRITQYLNNGDFLDIGFVKDNGEFLIASKAFAPNQKPVSEMAVSVAFGDIEKNLTVVGDRQWESGFFSSTSTTKQFIEMPLIYQNAYGALGYEQNPLGKGVIKKQYKNKETGKYDLPNIYLAKESTKADKEKRSVAGFGPLNIEWPQRTCYQGTYDQKWLENDHPGFPKDTNPKLFNAAPLDQQIAGFIAPNTAYSIKGMNAKYPVIKGRLPDVSVRAFICQQVGEKEVFKEVKTAIDTVWFFPELMLGVAIHRGVAEANDSDGLDVKKLMLACERASDTLRDMDYYQHVLDLRTDPETALAHVFNESQLMPAKTAAEQQHYDELYAESKRLQQQKREDVTQRYRAQIQKETPDLTFPPVDEAQEDLAEPAPIPQALIDSGDIDLSPYIDYANEMTKQVTADMEKQLSELKEQQKEYASQTKKEYESEASMKARVENIVFSTATDLEHLASYLPPEWVDHLPADYTLSAEQQKDVENAQKIAAKSAREARQNAPAVTVLSQPLSESGAQQIRTWVIELMASSASLASLAGRDLAGADLSGLDFSELDLRDVMLEKTNLTNCSFVNCRLDGAVFTGASLASTRFINSSMIKVNLACVQAKEAAFNQANLSHANMTEALFDQCDFSEAILDEIMAVNVAMEGCLFRRIHCEKGSFVEAKLTKSDWQQAHLKSCIFLQSELQYSHWKQATIERCLMMESKAEGADFSEIKAEKVQFSNKGDFKKANFSNGLWKTCGFRGLDMQYSKANDAVFIECDFGESRFDGASLQRSLFNNCIMSLVIFKKSDCRETYFSGTSLRKAQFVEADLRACEFVNDDMTECFFDDCMTKNMKQTPIPSIN